jgi:hypothetical protein
MRNSLEECKKLKAKSGSDCKCVKVAMGKKSVLRIPDKVMERLIEGASLKHDPKYKTKIIGDRTLDEVLFYLKSPRDIDYAQPIEAISLDEKHVYVVVRWGSNLREGEIYFVEYRAFYPSGKERPFKAHMTRPKSKTWRTWTKFILDKNMDEPGDWLFKVFLDGRKVAEKHLKVLPAR